MRRLLTLAVLVGALPAAAADLVEPWDAGLSSLELYVSHDDLRAGPVTEADLVLGAGLARGLSIGMSLWSDEHGSQELGGVLMLTRGWGAAEVDIWLDAGLSVATAEFEAGARRWGVGAEWSRPFGRQVPYLRLTAAREEDGTVWHPLVGVMIPLGGAVELHLEASGEHSAGEWTTHLAGGPNLAIGGDLELVPELTWLRTPLGQSQLAVSIGVIVGLR